MFHHDHRNDSPQKRRVFAGFEVLYTFVDFGAAFCFVVGSVMFFSEAWMTPGTWFFLIGSILFAFKPTIRLVRELRLLSMDDTSDLARKQE
ncbi:hypothetical protein ERN12_09385 [Rhodobacteraceae bacterium]|nr:hypothetical protein ERN12_09385 [Paracoccaceae bacterium]